MPSIATSSIPSAKAAYPVVGLNCAACHTNELYYGKHAVQVEGAPATIEVAAFQKALGLALAFNTKFPFSVGRYSRFEQRVLGPNATDAQKKALKDSYDAFLGAALEEKKVIDEGHIYDNGAGFRRTDALARIGNQVFGADTKIAANYVVSTAPVRFPQLWDASWLNWVQYNSSIADPLVRNIGEALGVRALVKLHGPDAASFENSVNVKGLRTLEDLLAGPGPLKGLASPKWPAVFPPLDQGKVARGAALYQQHCQSCHLPPLPDLLTDLEAAYRDGPPPKHWWKNALGNWFINVTDIGIEEIGTDPHEATDFHGRTADTGDLKKGVVSARVGLDLVTRGIANKFFEANKIPAGRASRVGRRPRPARRGRARRPDLQGPSAQRDLGRRSVPAQRVRAQPVFAAVARGRNGRTSSGTAASSSIQCWSATTRPRSAAPRNSTSPSPATATPAMNSRMAPAAKG